MSKTFTIPQTEDWNNDHHPSFHLQMKATEEQINRYLESCPVCWQKNCIWECRQLNAEDEISDLVALDDKTNETELQDWGLSACNICWKSDCVCSESYFSDESDHNIEDVKSSESYDAIKVEPCSVCGGAAYDDDACSSCWGLD